MTQFTQKELDEYWQDTAFDFPLKEKINEIEKLDVYLMNMRSQKIQAQAATRAMYSPAVFVLSFILVSLIWFFIQNTPSKSMPGVLTMSVIIGLILASVITPLFNICLNHLIFPKINRHDKIIQELNQKEALWLDLRKELSKEISTEENKRKILQSVDNFKEFMKKELPVAAHDFIEKNEFFPLLKQELKESYDEEDTQSIIDLLADYALCEHELKQDWNDLAQATQA